MFKWAAYDNHDLMIHKWQHHK